MLCILAYDQTGGWNLDQYDAQKGHTICFRTNIADCQIEKIVWTFSDNAAPPSTDKCACVVLRRDSGVGEPGEGFVTVSVAVTTMGQCRCARRTVLVVPEVKCQLEFDDNYLIGCNTRCIDVKVTGLCEALALGNPFPSSGIDGYACGGACLDECPRYELLMTPASGTKIYHYGRHCARSDVSIRGDIDQELCAPLYEKNFLGLHARYPPAETCFCIVPRNLEMRVESSTQQHQQQQRRWHKRFVIDNLSEHMLPDCARIKWRISNESGRTYWRETNRRATLCYEFRRLDYYCIEATIHYDPCCKPSKIKVYLKLVDHCNAGCDIVVQPKRTLDELLPALSLV